MLCFYLYGEKRSGNVALNAMVERARRLNLKMKLCSSINEKIGTTVVGCRNSKTPEDVQLEENNQLRDHHIIQSRITFL